MALLKFMTSHAEFELTYDGPAVEDGSMDVRDLAPALLAVGQFIEAANRVVHGDNATAKVQVRTVSPGSFHIGFDIGVSFLQSMRDMLAGPEATAAAKSNSNYVRLRRGGRTLQAHQIHEGTLGFIGA